jgi:hypothetical protein
MTPKLSFLFLLNYYPEQFRTKTLIKYPSMPMGRIIICDKDKLKNCFLFNLILEKLQVALLLIPRVLDELGPLKVVGLDW